MEQILTVTTAATSKALTTLANVKSDLGIATATTTDDALLNRYIDMASLSIAQFCNRIFVKQTYRAEFFVEHSRFNGALPAAFEKIDLSVYPVVSIASLTENGQALTDGTHYRLEPNSSVFTRLNGALTQPWSNWPVVINFDGGYVTVPADIEDACIRMVRGRYMARDRDPFLKQESIPGVRDVTYWVPSATDSGNMSPDVMDILLNYRTGTFS